jgi:hypothetical protein
MIHNFFQNFITVVLILVATSTYAQNGTDAKLDDKFMKQQSAENHFEFDNGWWRLNESKKREARISQCGFYSSLFILEYFEKQFNPLLVCENLPVSDAGVAVDTIQKLLQAHGLKTIGRKNVTFADLKGISNNNTVAIVAVPNFHDTAHYYVVAPTNKGIALIDAPFAVTLFEEIDSLTLKELDTRLASQGGIVLFVQNDKVKNVSKIAEHISVSPMEHNLGEFLIDVDPATTEPFRPRFEIQNTSVTPIAVEIQTSCGCVGKTNWKSKIIDAKSKETLEFEISPRSWINDKKTEVILLKFPDASQKFISITGTGHGGEGSPGMKLEDPSVLVFNIGFDDARGFTKKLARDVVLPSNNTDTLSVETNVSWIKTAITVPTDTINSDKKRICPVECEVTVSDEEITALCENDNILYGKITVTAEPSKMQVQFDVALRRNPLIVVTPDILYLVQDQKDNVIISTHENVRSTINDIKFRYYDEDDSSILCGLQRIDDTSYQAVISFTPNPHSRHQLVRFDVEFENGMKDSALVLASLKNDQ